MNFINENEIPKCPKCQKDMVKRPGKYGDFWGCSNYPRCKGIRKIYKKHDTPQQVRELKSIDKPNPRQKTIIPHYKHMSVILDRSFY